MNFTRFRSKKSTISLAVIAVLLVLSVMLLSIAFIGVGDVPFVAQGASSVVNANISEFGSGTVVTGAQIVLQGEHTDSGSGGQNRVATVNESKTALITIENTAILSAIANGRMKAKILVSGVNTFTTVSGTANIKSSATVSVGGALNATSDMSNVRGEFTDYEICDLTELTTASDQISITYSASHTATAVAQSTSGTTATVSLECKFTEIKVVFEFDGVEVNVSVGEGGSIFNKTANETIESGASASYVLGFNDELELEAVYANGYFFNGFVVNEATNKTNNYVLPKPYDVPKDVDFDITGDFQALFVENANVSGFFYTGAEVGQVVRTAGTGITTGFYYYHEYSGSPYDPDAGLFVASSGSIPGLETPMLRPSLAGEYSYRFTVFHRNEDDSVGSVAGIFETEFTIYKARTQLTINATDYNEQGAPVYVIGFGSKLSALNISYVARAAGIDNIPGKIVLCDADGNAVADTELAKMLEIGTYNYVAKFVPDDTFNFETDEAINADENNPNNSEEYKVIINNDVVVEVEDLFQDSSVNVDGIDRKVTITKTIATTIDGSVANNTNGEDVTNGVIKISLRASIADEDGSYFYVGWRLGYKAGSALNFTYKYVTLDKDYDYYLIPSSTETELYASFIRVLTNNSPSAEDLTAYNEFMNVYTKATFQAVFVKDTTTNDEGVLNRAYTGGSVPVSPTFDLQTSEYLLSTTTVKYYLNGAGEALSSAPSSIGSHKANYAVKVAFGGNDVEIKNREIALVITPGVIEVAMDSNFGLRNGYDSSTGWAKAFRFTLTAVGIAGNGVDAYYYSTDGVNWTKINGTIGSSLGCKITFEAPNNGLAVSSVNKYRFMATHAGGENVTLGGVDYSRVAVSKDDAAVCKIDGTTPVISSIATTYDGSWTKEEVNINATITYGGSGAVVSVSFDGSKYVDIADVLGKNYGEDASVVQNANVSFEISAEHSGNIYFRVTNGVSVVSNYMISETQKGFVEVNIDKTAPSIERIGSPQMNANGWTKGLSTFTFKVSDSNGSVVASYKNVPTASGVAKVECNNGAIVEFIGDGTYTIKISDNKRYQILVTDNAGNVMDTELIANIDSQDVEIAYDADSYVAGTWINTDAVIIPIVTCGPSGIRLSYSIDEGKTYTFFDGVGAFIDAEDGYDEETLLQQIKTSLVVSADKNVNQKYFLKAENRAGGAEVVAFGFVKIDVIAPSFNTVLYPDGYNANVWMNEDLQVKFNVIDDVEGSQLVSVTSDNGGEVLKVDGQPNQYSLVIDKCTTYTITATDTAGNVGTYEFVEKVDKVTPELTLVAYIGGGNPEDISIPAVGEYPEYDFINWVNTDYQEPWIRFEFTIALTASGCALQYSKNNVTWTNLTETYLPEDVDDVGKKLATRTYIRDEQETSYYFRLMTGSGKYAYITQEENDNQSAIARNVRIDGTAPVLMNEHYVVDNVSYDFINNWTYKDGMWSFVMTDSSSGIKQESISLVKYDIDVEDADILAGSVAGESQELFSQNYSNYAIFKDSSKYYFTFTDNANNRFARIFRPLVDQTTNFSISSFDVQVGAISGETSSQYSDGLWLNANEKMVFTASIAFDTANGSDKFGASGGGLEFSVDGGATWQKAITIGGETQAIVVDGNNYTMDATRDQMYTYIFRVATGAGYYVMQEGAYKVNKDNLNHAVTISAVYGGETYTGEWITGDIVLMANVTAGASKGTIYYGTGDDVDSVSEWIELAQAQEGTSQYNVAITVSANNNYFVKLVTAKADGFGGFVTAYSTGIVLNIDKDEIAPSIYATANGEEFNGGYANDNITLLPKVDSVGFSGISNVYYSYVEGTMVNGTLDYSGEWTEFVEIANGMNGSVVVSANDYVARLYKFKYVNGAGVEAVSDAFTANIDKIMPEFSLQLAGTKLPNTSIYSNWYISDVQVNFALTAHEFYNYSIYSLRYAISEDNGASFGEWNTISADTAYTMSYTLSDNGVKGGCDYIYRFSYVSMSGAETTRDQYIPIDTGDYSVTFETYVGDIARNDFAVVDGAGQTYKRGDQVRVGVTPNASYYVKSLYFYKNGELDSDNTGMTFGIDEKVDEKVSQEFIVDGRDLLCKANFYKELEVAYSNSKQYLQNGTIINIGVQPVDSEFTDIFGELGKDIALDVTYSDSQGALDGLPLTLGQYSVLVEIAGNDDNYIISNATSEFIIVYFTGNGSDIDPHLVKSEEDFAYIDIYMEDKPEYATNDTLAYLGANRKKAYFKQNNDITLTRNYKPMGATVTAEMDNTFRGTYDGNGYVIDYGGIFVRTSDFALFANTEQALIINTGVKFNIEMTSNATKAEDKVKVAHLIANDKGSAVKNSYAIGDVVLTGDYVSYGGLVAVSESTLLWECYTDVKISAKEVSGNIGGVVGEFTNSMMELVYATGTITIIDSNAYSSTAEIGTKFAYVGAMVGFITTIEDVQAPIQSNYFAISNLFFNSDIVTEQAIGNEASYSDNPLNAVGSTIQEFIEMVEVYIIRTMDREESVSDLVKVRIMDVKEGQGIDGLGTSDSPFIIDDGNKLKYIEEFPWAHFKQTQDISVSGSQVYASEIPFVGVYDGGNYRITGLESTISGAMYGGLFGVVGGTIKNVKLLNINLTYRDTEIIYVGGAVGSLRDGARAINVLVTGEINVYATREAYVGGVIGIASECNELCAIVASVGVNVVSNRHAVVGGAIGQIQGTTGVAIDEAVALSPLTADYVGKGGIGSVVGAVKSGSVSRVYGVSGNAYANGNVTNSAVGAIGEAVVTDTANYTYETLVGANSDFTIAGNKISSLIVGIYPFKAGEGTDGNPFQIESYNELMMIGSYMYASFVLVDDIVIGDLNDDGVLDAKDGYTYDYSPIGNGAVFTGDLNGTFEGVRHAISGLNDSLFDKNQGTIRHVTLNVSYKVYASADDIPNSELIVSENGTYTASKVNAKNEDVNFGAVAKTNLSGATINSVIVEGDIYVRTNGKGRVTAGAVVASDVGGNIIGVTTSLSMDVRAQVVEVGGIVGRIELSDTALQNMSVNTIQEDVYASGATVMAGLVVGSLKVQTSQEIAFVTTAKVYVNGQDLGEQFVGMAFSN